MESQQLIQSFLTVAISHSPLLLTYLIGAGIALGTWNRHRRVSALILIGCSILLSHVLILGTIVGVLPQMLIDNGWTHAQVTAAFNGINVIRSIISALGIACLLAAALVQRRQDSPSQ